MNTKASSFIKNIFYAISSNLVSLVVSALVILIIPKLLGVEEYGYWQLYLFYSSYVGFLHLGWIDGIYLRYGGEEYDKLDKKLFFSQFLSLFISQLIISIFIWGYAGVFITDINKVFIIGMVAITVVVVNLKTLFLFILQSTNRIKEYASITMIDRIVYIVLIIIFLLIGIRDYKLMVFADIIGKTVSLLCGMYSCKEIVFRKTRDYYFTIHETITNISVGIKLMFANIASMLIIGIVRSSIEKHWGIATFAKVSLTLSISNAMMIFVNAVGTIMFPILRRSHREKLPSIYVIMRDVLMVVLFLVLMAYYPMKTLMSAWLPQYAESLKYMALLFPMIIYEGKMSLLINTYLKTLRREKFMLQINVTTMLLSIAMTFITTKILNNLDITIVNILILLVFRSVVSEIYLSKELKVNIKKDIVLEVLLTIVFALSGWYINSWSSVVIYGVAYIIYLIIKRKDIYKTRNSLKLLIKA